MTDDYTVHIPTLTEDGVDVEEHRWDGVVHTLDGPVHFLDLIDTDDEEHDDG